MKQKKGYVYLRDNEWYIKNNVIKMGITSNIIDRNSTYKTGELLEGKYILVIEIPFDKMNMIDRMLIKYFKKYNIYKSFETKFYDKNIINLIAPYLQLLNINHKILTENEIYDFTRTEQLKNIINKNKKKLKLLFSPSNIKYFIEKSKNKRLNNIIISNEH